MSKIPVKISDKDAIIEELKRELQDYKNIIDELKDNNKIVYMNCCIYKGIQCTVILQEERET